MTGDDFRRAYRTARGGGYDGTKAEFQGFVLRAPSLFRPALVVAASEWQPLRRLPTTYRERAEAGALALVRRLSGELIEARGRLEMAEAALDDAGVWPRSGAIGK